MCSVAVLVVLVACGPASSSGTTGDASVRQHLLRGVEQIRVTHDRHRLRAKLARVIAALRRDRPSTPPVRRARTLALVGFGATRKGLAYELAFYENDSGNLPAATRDAALARRYRKLGAARLRAAGRALGLRIGVINGY